MASPTRTRCRATAWLGVLGYWYAAGLVPLIMSIRSVAVFRAGNSKTRIWLLFGPICFLHCSFAFTMTFFSTKVSG